MGEKNRIDRVTVANEAEDKRLAPIPQPELRVRGWVSLAFVAVAGALTAAIPLAPPGPWTIALTIAQGAVLAVGGGVAMLSSGKKN